MRVPPPSDRPGLSSGLDTPYSPTSDVTPESSPLRPNPNPNPNPSRVQRPPSASDSSPTTTVTTTAATTTTALALADRPGSEPQIKSNPQSSRTLLLKSLSLVSRAVELDTANDALVASWGAPIVDIDHRTVVRLYEEGVGMIECVVERKRRKIEGTRALRRRKAEKELVRILEACTREEGSLGSSSGGGGGGVIIEAAATEGGRKKMEDVSDEVQVEKLEILINAYNRRINTLKGRMELQEKLCNHSSSYSPYTGSKPRL